jgi:hypothetical protein
VCLLVPTRANWNYPFISKFILIRDFDYGEGGRRIYFASTREFTLQLCISFPVQSGSIPVRIFCFVEKSLGIVCSLMLDFLNIIYLFFKKYLDFSCKNVHLKKILFEVGLLDGFLRVFLYGFFGGWPTLAKILIYC